MEQEPPVEESASSDPPPGSSSPRAGKRPTPRKRNKKARKRNSSAKSTKTPGRKQRSFPASSFEDATVLANEMHRMGSTRVRRLTLFEELGRSAESSISRQLVINSGRYGLTSGGAQAEWIELNDEGQVATSPDVAPRKRMRARFNLAIDSIPPFKALYDEFVGKKLPSQAVMRDFLREKKYPDPEIQECIDTFIVNAKFVGILRPVAGSERLLSVDHALDELPLSEGTPVTGRPELEVLRSNDSATGVRDWSKTCFYLSPIGDEDSDERKHSDLFLGSIVEPALQEFGLEVVRADHIGSAGMITVQIIEHIVNSRVVVADLSYHNPNVFYEVALRHATRKPLVQLIRVADRIPFDLDQVRTIRIDTSDIFSLVPQIETYRSEVATQVRKALEGAGEVENPLTVFFPGFWDVVHGS